MYISCVVILISDNLREFKGNFKDNLKEKLPSKINRIFYTNKNFNSPGRQLLNLYINNNIVSKIQSKERPH